MITGNKEKNGRKRRKIQFEGIPMNKKIAEGEKLFGGSREGGRRKRILQDGREDAGKAGREKRFDRMGRKLAEKRGERKDLIGWEERWRESGEKKDLIGWEESWRQDVKRQQKMFGGDSKLEWKINNYIN